MKKVLFVSILLLVVVSISAQFVPEGAVDSEPARDLGWIWQVASAALVALGTFFKVTSDKFKGRASRAVKFGKEAVDVLQAGTSLAEVTLNAAADNVFTTEEKVNMKTAAEYWKVQKTEAVAAWKYMIAKDEDNV